MFATNFLMVFSVEQFVQVLSWWRTSATAANVQAEKMKS
jgi:hypothetical protein